MTEQEKVTCRKCGGEMKSGKAIANTFRPSFPDFPGQTIGVTMSPGGPGKIADCLKCEKCGYSVGA